MQTEDLILLNEYCNRHQVELTFIRSLGSSGLIDLQIEDDRYCIPEYQFPQLEKLSRLYYEMDINLEGIETICYLLDRMAEMQQQINQLSNKLKLYEDED